MTDHFRIRAVFLIQPKICSMLLRFLPADLITSVARRAPIDIAAPSFVLRHVRRNLQGSQLRHQPGFIVSLVGSYRGRSSLSHLAQHL